MAAKTKLADVAIDGPVPARRGVVIWSSTALLICSNGPTSYLLLHVFNRGGGGHAWISLYPFTAVAVAGVISLARRLRSDAVRNWPFVVFAVFAYVGWALLSAVWSVSSTTTATNAMIGIGIAAFGCWFGWCLTTAEQIWSAVLACSTAVMASAVVIAFLPQYGKTYPDLFPDSLWLGIFTNRNYLAPVCALGLIALVGFVALRPRSRRILAASSLASVHVILLRGSGGATSLAALGLAGFVALLVPAVWLLKRLGARGFAVGGVAALGAGGGSVWTFVNIERVASWMGRDTTLDGRRPIWREVRGFIREHPIRGYGFWAFWDRPDLTAATYARLGNYYSHAHNSVFEVMLGLGVIGLVFYLAVVLSALVGVAQFVWTRSCVGSWWWAAVLAFLVVQNLTESFVLMHSYNWVLFIAAAFVLFGPRSDPPVQSGESIAASPVNAAISPDGIEAPTVHNPPMEASPQAASRPSSLN